MDVRRRDDRREGLDRHDVEADPLAQLQVWLREAVEAGVAEPTAMTLATVDDRGRPAARTVLCKGVDADGLVFYTNLHSPKSRHLGANPGAAAVFLWQPLERQVRAVGVAELVDDTEADDYFATRPRDSQLAAWASAQSAVLNDRAELERAVADAAARFDGQPVPRPPHWGGWRLRPDEVELWQARAGRLHDRLRYRRGDGGWRIERLAP